MSGMRPIGSFFSSSFRHSAGLAIARRGLAAKPPSLVASRHIVPRTLTVFPKTLVRRQGWSSNDISPRV